MPNPTREQIHDAVRSESRDCTGPRNPEIMRQVYLDLGATREEADQVARAIEEENRKNGYVLDKAS